MKSIKNKRRFLLILGILSILLVTGILISVTIGSANISIEESTKILISKIPIIGKLVNTEGIEESHQLILSQIRLPRVLLAGLVGMGLAVCGAIYQGSLKNGMADPYILGVSAGASLGATIGIILRINGTVKILAFVFGLLVTCFVYLVARKSFKKNSTFLILTGMNINYFITAIVSLLMMLNKDQLDKIVFWTMGSLATSTWNDVIILACITIPIIFFISLFGKYLNAIALDEDTAKSVGINTSKFRLFMILATCLITALCVSVSGIIGFVGLMVPYIGRILFGGNYRYLLPITALIGAIFLILCDSIARCIIAPTEIPIGIITSIVGAPCLIYLIRKNKIQS